MMFRESKESPFHQFARGKELLDTVSEAKLRSLLNVDKSAPYHCTMLHADVKRIQDQKHCKALEIRNEAGDSPLHVACAILGYSANSNEADALLNYSANVNAINVVSGETPLHVAARTGACEVIRILLWSGADPTIKDKQGRTPWQAAVFPLVEDSKVKVWSMLDYYSGTSHSGGWIASACNTPVYYNRFTTLERFAQYGGSDCDYSTQDGLKIEDILLARGEKFIQTLRSQEKESRQQRQKCITVSSAERESKRSDSASVAAMTSGIVKTLLSGSSASDEGVSALATSSSICISIPVAQETHRSRS